VAEAEVAKEDVGERLESTTNLHVHVASIVA
jgi:hypothetical protein